MSIKFTSLIAGIIKKLVKSPGDFCLDNQKKLDSVKTKDFLDFNSFAPISLLPEYKNGVTPYLYTIQQNKQLILENLANHIKDDFGLYAKIGVELEFYLKPIKKDIKPRKVETDKIVKAILSECEKSNINILDLEEERGNSQFEIKTPPESDLLTLSKNIEKMRKIIRKCAKKYEFHAIFEAQPYINDCGSALQLNISLHNEKGGNIFKRKHKNGEFEETHEILHCIGGICHIIRKHSTIFTQNKWDFRRYNAVFNEELHKCGKFTAPTNISWGMNNRTTAIRIPSTKFNSTKEYDKVDESRRIENRVPCANCDVYLAIIGSLAGIYYGLSDNLTPPKKIFGNAYEIKTLANLEYKIISASFFGYIE